MRVHLAAIALLLSGSLVAECRPPNFVFILIDDLGWNDISCNGSTFHDTPNIDRLAAGGMRFDWAYAASPMCSPTRASILTGKHPARHGITQYIAGWRSSKFRYITPLTGLHLADEETTLGEALQGAGYRTAFMGKWHIGDLDDHGGPRDHGYGKEVAIIESNRCAMYFPFRGVPGYFPDAREGDYFTDKLTDAAIEYIEGQKDADEPFYLHLCHFAMHAPIESKPEERKRFAERAAKLPEIPDAAARLTDPFSHKPIKGRQDDPEYAGELANLDENIGRLMDAIDAAGIAEETVVIFTSDNGGRSALEWHGHPTSVHPLRGGKTFVFEGGIRVPLIVRWPGVTRPGGRCATPVISMDFYPTMLEMAGLPLQPLQHADGVSLAPLLRGGRIDREELFWHFPHYQGEGAYPASAIRSGDFKLVRHFHFERDELFDLSKDPEERQDLSAAEPDKAREMATRLEAWFDEIGAKLPVKNASDEIVDEISERHRDKNVRRRR